MWIIVKKIAIMMKKEPNKSVIRFSMHSRLQIGKIVENAGILKLVISNVTILTSCVLTH